MDLDADHISHLYRQHASAMLRYFARRTCDPEIAADLLAETFARAFEQRRKFNGDSGGELIGWLHAIGRNALTDYLRRGVVEKRALARLKIERPALTETEYDLIEERSTLADLRDELPRHVERLIPEQRAAIMLRVIQEQSYETIAQQLDITEQAARARVSRGLRALRDSLPLIEPDPEPRHA